MAPARRFGPAVARKSTFTPIRDPCARRDDADPEIFASLEWESPAESLDAAGRGEDGGIPPGVGEQALTRDKGLRNPAFTQALYQSAT